MSATNIEIYSNNLKHQVAKNIPWFHYPGQYNTHLHIEI